jgi:tRNA threonylcarbamoyladenosine modification (KEOPS) complex Cgi121 subunit
MGGKIMLHIITQKQIEEAIEILANELSNELLAYIYEINQKAKSTRGLFHFSLGIRVRNILRKNAFEWNDSVFDDLWKRLITEAANKAMEKGGL